MSMVINPFWNTPSSEYDETGQFGYTLDASINLSNPTADQKYGAVITSPTGGVWVKHMYMSFFNGVTSVPMRPVLYSGSGSPTDPLFYQGPDFACPSTFSSTITELGPFPWQVSGDAIFMPAGDYILGMMFGNSGMTMRAADAVLGPTLRATDGFIGGASDPYGAFDSFLVFPLMRMPYSVGGP